MFFFRYFFFLLIFFVLNFFFRFFVKISTSLVHICSQLLPNSSPFSIFCSLNIFFSKFFFSLFRKDLDELSSDRVTTMAQFLTIFEILAFEYFFFENFFFAFSERFLRVEFNLSHNYSLIPHHFRYFVL